MIHHLGGMGPAMAWWLRAPSIDALNLSVIWDLHSNDAGAGMWIAAPGDAANPVRIDSQRLERCRQPQCIGEDHDSSLMATGRIPPWTLLEPGCPGRRLSRE
jgi:hypothetical protein